MAVYLTDIQGALHTRLSGNLPFTSLIRINNGGGYAAGANSMTVDPLPFAIGSPSPPFTVLQFNTPTGKGTFTLTSAAAEGDTTISSAIGLVMLEGTSIGDNSTAEIDNGRAPGLVLEDDDVQSKMEALLNRVRVMAIVLRPISMIRVLEKTVVDFNWEVDTIENPAVNRPATGTFYTAEAVAESVFVLLDNYQIPNSTVTGTNSSRSTSIVRMGTEEPAGSLVRYKVSGFVRSKLNVNIT
tara:strand:- start:9285 stop:10007 length:723 start_codon:yes stop_codon:yes gene_type:complete